MVYNNKQLPIIQLDVVKKQPIVPCFILKYGVNIGKLTTSTKLNKEMVPAILTTIIVENKISKARREKNLSQAQLAQQLSISSQAVGKWERGESMPDIITFNRLAEILGVELNYFSDIINSLFKRSSLKGSNFSKSQIKNCDFTGIVFGYFRYCIYFHNVIL